MSIFDGEDDGLLAVVFLQVAVDVIGEEFDAKPLASSYFGVGAAIIVEHDRDHTSR